VTVERDAVPIATRKAGLTPPPVELVMVVCAVSVVSVVSVVRQNRTSVKSSGFFIRVLYCVIIGCKSR
jgi:hypothetical protein